MLWNIPGCSGMFHVPGLIDDPRMSSISTVNTRV